MTSDADIAARIARQRALALEHAAATTCASLACERRDAALTNVDEGEISRRAAIVRRGVTRLTPAVRQ